MKLFSSVLLVALAATLICVPQLYADSATQARVKAALAIAKTKAKAGCGCDPCTCVAGECGSPNCLSLTRVTRSKYPTLKENPGPIEDAAYLIQYNKAIQQNKPLLIWVGETCPSYEQQWTEFVHARLSEYDGKQGAEFGPEVIVGKPDGLGGMDLLSRLNGIPTKNAVDAVVALAKPAEYTNPYKTNPHWPYQSVQPMFQPMPMMMPMMGGCDPMGCGFGGGMMMGGFGGGCSSCH